MTGKNSSQDQRRSGWVWNADLDATFLFLGGMVSLYLCGGGGLTSLVGTCIQHPFRPKPSSERHAALPLSGPSVISLFDKNPETWIQEEVAVPLKTFSCPLTDSHTEMSNHRFQERHAISYLYAVLSAPAAHWEVHVLCLDNPPPSLPLPLSFPYYWWLHRLLWDLPFVVVMFRGQQGWTTDPADSALLRYQIKVKVLRSFWLFLEHYSPHGCFDICVQLSLILVFAF